MNVNIAPSWKEKLQGEFEKPYFQQLTDFIKDDIKQHKIYPPGKLIFNAFEKCSFDDTKVVIIGQDPYHGEGQAHGLCFSVNEGVAVPPSLVNIFKEIQSDLGKPVPRSGNLERWASQGVLLLNATLTVRANTPGSHQKRGWEEFTDEVIKILADEKQHLVFMLWGKYAQDKGRHISRQKHLVLTAKHPSPMSANGGGWFGCKHFSQANAYLRAHGLPEIDW